MDGWSDVQAYPVVLRFEGMYPHQLAGYEAHRTRRGGDVGHTDAERSYLNRRLIGSETWATEARAEIEEMALENYEAELASLEKRGRKKDLLRRIAEGPKQPWRPSRSGPLREVILTANRRWFEDDIQGAVLGRPEMREEQFERYAIAWLKDNFGEDVVHARADRDEACYHIHAVIVPRETVTIAKPKTGAASATRRMLQPSRHPLIRDYEAAQDSAGEWFADIGLTRGERRAEAIREACRNGEVPPDRRYHVRPAEWRAEEQLRLARLAAELDARQAELDESKVNLEARQGDLEERDAGLDARQAVMDETQVELEQRRIGLNEREAVGDAQQAELDVWRAELDESNLDLEQRQVGLDEREAKVDARQGELDARQLEVDGRRVELQEREVELD
ncbi:MAG: hypothetical protein V2I43_08435, partial [Parvularcula sp.]|nr:hypothetical protein [Parvularcula sp.]